MSDVEYYKSNKTIFLICLAYILTITIYFLHTAWPFMTDDAFISLRYSLHWYQGHGLLWNLHEAPVEGYSNFLFVVLGAISYWLHIEPTLFLRSICIAALFASYAVVYKIARLWLQPLLALLPLLFLSSQTGVIWWTVSGLETILYLFFCLAAFLCFFYGVGYYDDRAIKPHNPLLYLPAASVFALLAALTRIEGSIVFAVLSIGCLISYFKDKIAWRKQTSAWILFIAIFSVLYAIYFLWRWHYFGKFFPNSVYCKRLLYLQSGKKTEPFRLILDFIYHTQYYLLFALIPLLCLFDLRVALISLFSAIYFVVVYNIDPVTGYNIRYLIPSYAFITIFAAVGLNWIINIISRKNNKHRWHICLVAVCVIALIPIQMNNNNWMKTWAAFCHRQTGLRRKVGEYLNEHADANDYILMGDVGMTGYVLKAKVTDYFCLNSRVYTSAKIHDSPYRFLQFALAQKPKAVVMLSYSDTHLLTPKYYRIETLKNDLEFKKDYRLAMVMSTGADKYYYYIYLRKNNLGA